VVTMAGREISNGPAPVQPTAKIRIKSVGKIFISYRRDDSAAIAGRIRDWLVQRVPSADVFFDVDSIQYGVDFERRIQSTIPQCKAVLAIIGPHWLTEDGQPSAPVAMELELARSRGVAIMPVLVENATMPSDEHLPLSLQRFQKINAAQVRAGRDFQHDMEDLARALGIPVAPRSLLDPRSARFWIVLGAVLFVLSVSIAGLLNGFLLRTSTNNPLASTTATAAVAGETRAAATANAATAAAQSAAAAAATATALAPYSYSTPKLGPNCAATGQWEQQAAPSGDVGFFTCLTDSAQLATNDPTGPSIWFHGADGFTFPVRNVTAVDLFKLQGTACPTMAFDYTLQAATETLSLTLCEGGSWTLGENISRRIPSQLGSGGVPAATSYHIAVTFDGTSATFSINSQTVITTGVTQAASLIRFGVEAHGASRATVQLANFSIAALP
jgi:hypothetical protein